LAEAKKTKVSDMLEEFFADKQKMSSVLKGIEVVFEIADKYPNTRWLKRAVLVLKIVLQLSQPAIKIYREWLRQERREEPKFLEGLLKSADQATKGKPNEMLEKAKEFINVCWSSIHFMGFLMEADINMWTFSDSNIDFLKNH
jgi:hypothetical protein